MSSTVLAPLLGLVVAFLFALSAYFQQRAARKTHRHGRSVAAAAVALMSTLVRDRVWLQGWAFNLAGFGVQALALHLGSVATVQPMLATQLLFALPMSSLEQRIWPRARDWLGAGCLCAGLVVLILVVHVKPLEGEPDRSRILLSVIAVAAAIIVLIPIASRLGPDALVLVSGACAGLCFAMTAVFIKLTTDDLVNHGVGYTARDWVGYALAASTLFGLVLGQGAFANGPLPWAVAAKETSNPIASYAIGVLAFPVQFPTGAGTLIGLGVAGALVILGAVALAHSPSADLWLRRTEDQGAHAVS
ncbi:MAG TPA: DMT family transporter [Nocardioides sp.]|uniref:DMT family transporter n=1 Tax=Nocardioides sp. TaxID=35761 RepID=UPI002F42C4BD